jgi:hypothetical protein
VDPVRSPDSDRADRRTLGCVVALGAVVSAAVVGHNPLNIDAGLLRPLYFGLDCLVAAVALTYVAHWSFRSTAAHVVVAVVGAMASACFAAFLAVAILLTTDVDEDETVLATQGDVRLVQVDGYAIIDPVQRVELQRTFGPLSQATVVWQGRPEGDTADTASFSGPREATVTVTRWDGRVCTYRTGFDALTLAPDQPYDDWEPTGSGC